MLKMFPLFVMGIIVLNSCEAELDDLGSQLVDGSSAYDKAYSLIAYNINNNDTIRTDASQLDSVRIGAFHEQIFGGQKASYITQVRLGSYNPSFGTNPVIDSVVLTLKPKYETASDSITTSTDEDYIYPEGTVAAKKVLTTYKVSKYGKAKINGKTLMNIKVHEVTDFLGGVNDKLFSNKAVTLGAEVGSKVFDGTINSVVITKDSDASEILNRAASFRIPLNKDFFKDKIIAKQGDQVLKDAASFIRYFKGLSISVEENDGYLFTMTPNSASIVIYYKNDVTTDGVVTRTSNEFSIDMGSSNVHLSQIAYNRTGSAYASGMSPANAPNNTYGDPLLYAQGMGGAGFGIKIPASTITQLRDLYKNKKIGITSAKIRLYNDDASWNNSYKKPYGMLVKEKDSTRFLPDMSSLSAAGFSLLKTANLSTKDAYYDIGITESLKKIIEQDSNIQEFTVNIGSYKTDASTGALLGQAYNTRAYTPNRIVLKGTDSNNTGAEVNKDSKFAQLRIIFTEK